jgi:hypothetical protein
MNSLRWLSMLVTLALVLGARDAAGQAPSFPSGLAAHWRLDDPPGEYPSAIEASFAGDESTPPSTATATLVVRQPPQTADGWLLLAPAQIEFGSQPVNTTSAAQTITVTNPGPPVTLGAILLSGTDASSFAATNGCLNRHLATGESCGITVSFAPVHIGPREARLKVGDLTNTVVLRGSATGTTPTYVIPRYNVELVETGGFSFPNLFITGFNNADDIAGFVTRDLDRWCGDETFFRSAFVISGGTFTELRNVPGSPLNGVIDGCPLSSMSVGIDDGGTVFGVVNPPDFSAPESFRYADGSVSNVSVPSGDWAWGVTPGGILLTSNWSYWFEGNYVPLSPPEDLENVYCAVFDASLLTYVNVRNFCGVGMLMAIESAGGLTIGDTPTADGPPTASVYRDGVFAETGAGRAAAVAVNSAGQAILWNSSGWNYWDRRVGLHPLNSLVPEGWSVTTGFPGALDLVRPLNENGHILTLARDAGGITHLVVLKPITSMPAGSNVVAQSGNTTLTFANVTSTGTTIVEPIDASTAGSVPGGFAISQTMAYEIDTTATFSGPVTLAFVVPGTWSEAEFTNLRVLHNENGSLVDITTGYDYSKLTIFATTTSFSPFYIARRGMNIAPLFDPTKAYKAGSTVPIKLQVRDASDANISSAALTVTARKLVRIGDATDTTAIDAGHANADGGFRFDPSLGGTGGYIFNLSTKTLTRGRYSLNLTVGGDEAFVYNLSFEIR